MNFSLFSLLIFIFYVSQTAIAGVSNSEHTVIQNPRETNSIRNIQNDNRNSQQPSEQQHFYDSNYAPINPQQLYHDNLLLFDNQQYQTDGQNLPVQNHLYVISQQTPSQQLYLVRQQASIPQLNYQMDQYNKQKPSQYNNQQPDNYHNQQQANHHNQQQNNYHNQQQNNYHNQQPDKYNNQQTENYNIQQQGLYHNQQSEQPEQYSNQQNVQYNNQQPEKYNQQRAQYNNQQPEKYNNQQHVQYKNQQQNSVQHEGIYYSKMDMVYPRQQHGRSRIQAMNAQEPKYNLRSNIRNQQHLLGASLQSSIEQQNRNGDSIQHSNDHLNNNPTLYKQLSNPSDRLFEEKQQIHNSRQQPRVLPKSNQPTHTKNDAQRAPNRQFQNSRDHSSEGQDNQYKQQFNSRTISDNKQQRPEQHQLYSNTPKEQIYQYAPLFPEQRISEARRLSSVQHFYNPIDKTQEEQQGVYQFIQRSLENKNKLLGPRNVSLDQQEQQHNSRQQKQIPTSRQKHHRLLNNSKNELHLHITERSNTNSITNPMIHQQDKDILRSNDDLNINLNNQHMNLNNQHMDLNSQHINLNNQHMNLNSQHMNLNNQNINLSNQHMDLNSQHMNLNNQHININKQSVNLKPINLNNQNTNLYDQYTSFNNKQHNVIRDQDAVNTYETTSVKPEQLKGMDITQVSNNKVEATTMSQNLFSNHEYGTYGTTISTNNELSTSTESVPSTKIKASLNQHLKTPYTQYEFRHSL